MANVDIIQMLTFSVTNTHTYIFIQFNFYLTKTNLFNELALYYFHSTNIQTIVIYKVYTRQE